MAEVTIRFRYNPSTGKRELLIEYESEEDMLPHEHERDHRALAEKLLGAPLADDIDGVRVQRAGHGQRTQDAAPADAAPKREKLGEGG